MMPATKIATDNFRLVIGLGETGWSVARYLAKRQLPFAVADTRENPPYGRPFHQQYPTIPYSLGSVDDQLIRRADELVLSPGISHDQDFVTKAKKWNKPLVSDISIFRHEVSQPIVAISGSNGKSTVTSLLSAMAKKQGIHAAAGGNLGPPALDLIAAGVEVYILELSSFQLELTNQLAANVAALINVTPDHNERYGSFQQYYDAKQKIFSRCKAAVYNKSDKLSLPLFVPQEGGATAVGLGPPDKGEWGILNRKGEEYLADGVEPLMPVSAIRLLGKHNWLNVLMALAIAAKMSWAREACLAAVREFSGLAHRCEFVAKIRGVDYINDSKATNPAAASSALEGLAGAYRHIHIILGGSSKQADFSPVKESLASYQTTAYLIGEEAQRIRQLLGDKQPIELCSDMSAAFSRCSTNAKAGDLVLLSPACASFDSYDSFGERGDHFKSMVTKLQDLV